MKKSYIFLLLGLSAATSFGAAFGSGDLVVVQSGDGSAALSSAATAAFLDEFPSAGGSMVQQIALPTSAIGGNAALTLSGSATSEGFLTLSANGQYLTVAGYNQAPGTASVTGSIGNRTVARIDLNGNIDTTTVLNDATSIGNVRSVISDNGSGIWVDSSSGGIRYVNYGTTGTSVQLSSTPSNVRVVNIFAGQLYTSSASGAFQGIASVGTGVPTTSGQTTTLLPGFPTSSGPSPYDYVFANSTTLYVADDRSATSSGGLQKWIFNGSSWSLAYTLNSGITAGLRGLTATTDGAGNETLYATTAESSANKLVSITDSLAATTLPGSETFTIIATAAANTAYRGVEFIPTAAPEPASAALGLLGLIAAAAFRRLRK